MKTKAIIPLVLGLCVGLVAVKYLVDTLQNARGSPTDIQTTLVVRAKLDIGSLETITAEMVELIETADSALTPAHERFDKLEDVTGRVTAKAIPSHSPVLQSMLAPEGTMPGMKGKIKPGFRAVSVKISETSGVAYHIKPGDWVDVIVVMDVDTGGRKRRKETIAEVILQHVEVVAIGHQTTGGQPSETGKTVKPAKSATLLVAEEEAPKLHLAATRGKITLTLRGDGDLLTGAPPSASESKDFDFVRQLNPEPTETVATTKQTPQAAWPGGFVEREPQPVPHNMMIYHGTKAADMSIEQLVFADGESREVVAVGSGPVDRATPAGYSGQRRSQQRSWPTPPQPDRVETLPADQESDIEDKEAE